MKRTTKKIVSIVLSVVLVLSIFAVVPFSTFAANDYTINSTTSTDNYYNLISKKDWDIAPGITESEIVLNNEDGTRRQALFVMEADLNNEYVKVINSYNGMVPEYGNYQIGVMSEQAAYAEANGYGNVVGAMNTTLSWYTNYAPERVNEPLGFIMLDAEILFDPANCGYNYGNVGFPSVLVINKDYDESGNARPADIPKVEMPQIRSAEDLDGWEDQVIPCSSGYIVKDGVNLYTANHDSGAPRSVVGIKPDGSVVIMLNDGRQSPYSEGMTMYELAEVMLDLGCSYAVNCDGGGSSTYLSQRPGEELKVNNSPSDGAERSTTTGILFISTAPSTGEFVRAIISSEDDYYTPGSTVNFSVMGSDLVGAETDIPEEATWKLADPSMGTIENGVFVSNGTTGEVTVQMVYNDTVVGEDTINIVVPDSLSVGQSSLVAPYGESFILDVQAFYGYKEVAYMEGDITVSLSDSNMGILNGFEFTATEDTAIESGEITLKYSYNSENEVVLTVPVTFGRGSEVIFDFEGDGDFELHNNVNYSNLRADLEYVTRENGKVKSGNGALAVKLDYSQVFASGGWIYSGLNINQEEDIVIPADAVSFGMWIYIPDEAVGLELDFRPYHNVSGTYKRLDLIPFENGFATTFDESGWHYVSVDTSTLGELVIPGTESTRVSVKQQKAFMELYNPDTGNSGYGYDGYANDAYRSINGNFTIYLDDMIVDYSAAVDDREEPTFAAINYICDDFSDPVEMNGQTISENSVVFTAKATENTTKLNYSGLNLASAKAYIDGLDVTASLNIGADGTLTISGKELKDGVHTVKFSIEDNSGNYASIIRQIDIQTGSDAATVKVQPKDATLDRIAIGSLYYMDIVATDIASVDKIEVQIDINNNSEWEPQGLEVADGFSATCVVDEETETATIVIEKTGEVELTGEAVVASIPARTWESTRCETVPGYTLENLWEDRAIYAQDMQFTVRYGKLTCVDGSESSFSAKKHYVVTELEYGRKTVTADFWNSRTSYHQHTVEAVADVAATCDKAGCTGRTFCAACNSVVDWGTVVPALGHEWAVNADGKLACVNGGELFSGVYTDGKTYVDGAVVADGWNADNTAYYKDGVKLTGAVVIDKAVYTFDSNGVYQPTAIFEGFIESEEGLMYFYSNTNYEANYSYINNVAYYFVDGIAKDGEYVINGETCLFEDGKFVSCSTADVMDAGWMGVDVNYIIYADGSMILGGEGATYKYTSRAMLPWAKLNTKIRSIVVGKDITALNMFALADIYYANTITFEEGSKLEYIGAGAVLSNYRITEIVFPDSLETIAQNAFKMCKNLVDVYLPYNIKTVNKLAFVNNQNVVMEKIHLHVYEGTYAESYAVNMGIPYSIREFVDSVVDSGTCGENTTWTFYASGKMVIGGSGAMDNYSGKDATPWADYLLDIKSIEIGKDVTKVGNYAFGYAHNVESVTFEEGSQLDYIGAAAFMYMLYTTEVVIPETVEKIGNNAFSYCSRLASVVVPQNVSLIYLRSFYKCPNLVLNVTEGTYGESYAKANSLNYVTRAFVDSVIASGTCGENATWTLYNSGKMIIGGSGAMDNYSGKDATPWAAYLLDIKSIVIGKDITKVGNYAFGYAHNVESVTFEEGSQLDYIGAAAFMYMLYTTEVVIPETVEKIGNNAFSYCSRLANVVVPQNVSLIYLRSFYKCPNLVLNVTEGTYGESYAKANSLNYVTREFVDVVAASGTCGENATWTLYESGEMVIGGSGAMDNYANKDATPWAAYLLDIKSIVIGKDITKVGNYAFGYAHNVKSVTFEEGSQLEYIGAAAFMYMLYTTEVVIPETVDKIGNNAFSYCSRLASVVVPQNVSHIYARSFYKCPNLVLTVASGSYAESFAQSNGIDYLVK